MEPDTPASAAASRRRTDLIVACALAGVCLVVAAGLAVAAGIDSPSPAAQQQSEASPSPYIIPTAVSLGPITASPAHVDVASPLPPQSETCSDSAAWDQEGGTTLIDAYIDNQDSGNIKVEDIKAGCPQYLPVWQRAQGGIPSGSSFAVPSEVKPGTYETTSNDLEDCYWERSRNGEIVDNRFITASKVKQRVTIRSTDDTFVTRDCGLWIKVR